MHEKSLGEHTIGESPPVWNIIKIINTVLTMGRVKGGVTYCNAFISFDICDLC